MMIMDLLPILIMIIFGIVFLKRPPKKINRIYGFRSKMSMKNMDTWNYSNKLLGKLWLVLGVFFTPVIIIPMLLLMPVYGQDNGSIITTVSLVLLSISLVAMIFSIIPVELSLRKNFDKDGNIIEPRQ